MFNDIGNYLTLAEKIFGELGAIVYLVFAAVVVKQVGAMTKNVKDMFNGVLIVISYIHLILAILLVFLTWMIL